MAMCGCSVLVGGLAMLMSCVGVLLGLFVLAGLVMMACLMMMMRGSMVVGGRLLMMLTGRMLW
jgi:hypothetical protein